MTTMQAEKTTVRYSALCMTGQCSLCAEAHQCECNHHAEILLKNGADTSRSSIIQATAYHCYNAFREARIKYDYELEAALTRALPLLGVPTSKKENIAITNAIVNMAAQGAWSNRLIDEAIKSAR